MIPKHLIFVLLMVSLSSCHYNKKSLVNNQKDTSINNFSLIDKVIKVEPPESFILELKEIASDVAKIKVTSIDSINGSIRVYNGNILKVYKGNTKVNSKISFGAIVDVKYVKFSQDTLIAFLVKHEMPLKNLKNIDKIYFSTVEENALFIHSQKIDSLLKIKI